MTERELIEQAIKGRMYSYAPYSGFRVGAAIETKEGEVYTGCNIENAAYGPTNCAERTAIFKAVSEGKRNFSQIAIIGGKEAGSIVTGYATPCGVCRQVMMEFCDPGDFKIIVAKSVDDYIVYTLEQLMPEGFGPNNLEGGCDL